MGETAFDYRIKDFSFSICEFFPSLRMLVLNPKVIRPSLFEAWSISESFVGLAKTLHGIVLLPFSFMDPGLRQYARCFTHFFISSTFVLITWCAPKPFNLKSIRFTTFKDDLNMLKSMDDRVHFETVVDSNAWGTQMHPFSRDFEERIPLFLTFHGMFWHFHKTE